MTLLLYVPNHRTGPVPVFLGLNFHGNHTVDPDPAISLAEGWVPEQPDKGLTGHQTTAVGRGAERTRSTSTCCWR